MKACYLRLLHVGKQNVRWGFEYKNEISCIQPSLRQMLSAKILLLAFDMFVIPSFHFVIALVYIQLFISYIGFIVVVQWRNITTSNGVKSLYQKWNEFGFKGTCSPSWPSRLFFSFFHVTLLIWSLALHCIYGPQLLECLEKCATIGQ
jgi:hypothetical protein